MSFLIDWTTLPIKSHTTTATSGSLNLTWQVRELYDGTKIYDGFGYGNWWFGASSWALDTYITLPTDFVYTNCSLQTICTADDAACEVFVGGDFNNTARLPIYRTNRRSSDITTTVRIHCHLVVYSK